MASNPQEYFYINPKKKRKTPTLINVTCSNHNAEGEYLESIRTDLVNTEWTSAEFEQSTTNVWKFYCWDGTSVFALHFEKNGDERLKIIRDKTPVIWASFALQQRPYDFCRLLEKLPISKVVESPTAAESRDDDVLNIDSNANQSKKDNELNLATTQSLSENKQLGKKVGPPGEKVRKGLHGHYLLASKNGNHDGDEVPSGVRLVSPKQKFSQSSANELTKVSLKYTGRFAYSPITLNLMNKENEAISSNRQTTLLSYSTSAENNVECHSSSRLETPIKQVLREPNRVASQTPESQNDLRAIGILGSTSDDNNQQESMSCYTHSTSQSSSKSNSFDSGSNDESSNADENNEQNTSREGSTETYSRRSLGRSPASVTSHFLFLCAFSELPLNKKAAVVYMLGFVMLALALGGTSLLGVGVATAATVLGYAGASMMLAGATLMFFNESKQVPRARDAQARQDSPCCV